VFEQFTEPARQVVVFAQDEARALGHNYIGTEHVLLGLLREEEGLGARVLVSLGISLDAVRDQVARIIGQGDDVQAGQIPFTPRAKRVLELSLREALQLGHSYIGTEHLLLGLAAEREGVACRILLDFDVNDETLRDAVIGALSGAGVPGGVQGSPRIGRTPRRVSSYAGPRRFGVSAALVLGWLLFAVALAVGVLIGWAIWG
jgi:ATP-dependent Clp protease ATP-binding subunit ClpC